MQWTRSALASACLMKAQETAYAAFASGSLTVAILNIAALALVWSMRALLLAKRETPCPDAGHREEPLQPSNCSNPCSPRLRQVLR